MLQGTGLLFISAERLQGISKKSGNPYDIGTITLSDSLESVDIPIVPEIVEAVRASFKKGDSVKVVVDAIKQFGRHTLTVTAVEKFAKA